MSSPLVMDDIITMNGPGHGRAGVIWDFDPNMTHEIYEDLGVMDLDKVDSKQCTQKQKNKNLQPQKVTLSHCLHLFLRKYRHIQATVSQTLI